MATRRVYPFHEKIKRNNLCDEIFLPTMYEFNRNVWRYLNALLNSCGGIIKVGVRFDGYVEGISCTRQDEDKIKLAIDNILKYFQPKVSPSLYRMDFIPCYQYEKFNARIVGQDILDVKVLEIHVSSGSEILYMDARIRKSMVLHNGKAMELFPQQIRALAVAKYKQEILTADSLWDVITPACFKKKESKLKSTLAMCTQTTPGLAPLITPKPKPGPDKTTNLNAPNVSTPFPVTPVGELFHSPENMENMNTITPKLKPGADLSADLNASDVSTPCVTPVAELFYSPENINTIKTKPKQASNLTTDLNAAVVSSPCPTPVAELFCSPENSHMDTVVKNTNNKCSLSPDNSGSVTKKISPRLCKKTAVVAISPDVLCVGSYKNGLEDSICIIDASPEIPFAAKSTKRTVVKRVLRSSKSKVLDTSIVKNPSDLFKENNCQQTCSSSNKRGRSKSRQKHKSGHRKRDCSSKKLKKGKEKATANEREHSKTRRRHTSGKRKRDHGSKGLTKGKEGEFIAGSDQESCISPNERGRSKTRRRYTSGHRTRDHGSKGLKKGKEGECISGSDQESCISPNERGRSKTRRSHKSGHRKRHHSSKGSKKGRAEKSICKHTERHSKERMKGESSITRSKKSLLGKGPDTQQKKLVERSRNVEKKNVGSVKRQKVSKNCAKAQAAASVRADDNLEKTDKVKPKKRNSKTVQKKPNHVKKIDNAEKHEVQKENSRKSDQNRWVSDKIATVKPFVAGKETGNKRKTINVIIEDNQHKYNLRSRKKVEYKQSIYI